MSAKVVFAKKNGQRSFENQNAAQMSAAGWTMKLYFCEVKMQTHLLGPLNKKPPYGVAFAIYVGQDTFSLVRNSFLIRAVKFR